MLAITRNTIGDGGALFHTAAGHGGFVLTFDDKSVDIFAGDDINHGCEGVGDRSDAENAFDELKNQ